MLKGKIIESGIIVQKIVISILLFFIYYLVFGLTAVIAFLFNRKMLTGTNDSRDTSWIEADGYDADKLTSKMQS